MRRGATPDRPGDELSAIGALAEQTRRALYEFVAADGGWVSRDRAADGIGIERGAASHHLDRLAADGLCDVDFQRLSGKQGPGAGRPAKLYRRSRREFEVSLPQRDYQMAGRLLADAVDRSRTDGTAVDQALEQSARDEGRRIGSEMRARIGGRGRSRRHERRRAIIDTLSEHGYEPIEADDGHIVLRNCPFHQLARQHTDLICGMNLCLVAAALEQIEGNDLQARLQPDESFCCVRLG